MEGDGSETLKKPHGEQLTKRKHPPLPPRSPPIPPEPLRTGKLNKPTNSRPASPITETVVTADLNNFTGEQTLR